MLALTDLLVESVLRGADVLLVGDPEVLAHIDELPAEPGLTTTPAGTALVLHGGASSFVWVVGKGAVDDVRVSLSLDALDEPLEPVGAIDCPSGHLVVGTPEAVAAWGEGIEPADGLVAQARAYTSGRRHCGLIVVARVLPGPRQVFATGDLDALVVDCTARQPIREELLLAG